MEIVIRCHSREGGNPGLKGYLDARGHDVVVSFYSHTQWSNLESFWTVMDGDTR